MPEFRLGDCLPLCDQIESLNLLFHWVSPISEYFLSDRRCDASGEEEGLKSLVNSEHFGSRKGDSENIFSPGDTYLKTANQKWKIFILIIK